MTSEEIALGKWDVRFSRAKNSMRKIKTAKMEWPIGQYHWVCQFIVNGEVVHELLAMDRECAIEIKQYYTNVFKRMKEVAK